MGQGFWQVGGLQGRNLGWGTAQGCGSQQPVPDSSDTASSEKRGCSGVGEWRDPAGVHLRG